MSKHTPGPWSIIWEQRGAIITAKDECYDIGIVRDIGNEDNKANARLVAAAPELLEALQLAADFLEHSTQFQVGHPGFEQAQAKARAAIKKATGDV